MHPKFSVGNTGERPLRIYGGRWEISIKMDFNAKEVLHEKTA
jgi:hypothetical protein